MIVQLFLFILVNRIRPEGRILPSTIIQPSRNTLPVPVLAHLQVTLEPILRTNFYNFVSVSINISD